jgi:hypothetical protein
LMESVNQPDGNRPVGSRTSWSIGPTEGGISYPAIFGLVFFRLDHPVVALSAETSWVLALYISGRYLGLSLKRTVLPLWPTKLS